MKFITTKYTSYEIQSVLVLFDDSLPEMISYLEIDGSNLEILNNLSINNECIIKSGCFSEFKDSLDMLLKNLKDKESKEYQFLFKYINANIKYSYKQTYLDLFLLSRLSIYIEEKSLKFDDSLAFLRKKNPLFTYILTNLIPIEPDKNNHNFIYFYYYLYVQCNSSDERSSFYSLCSYLTNQTNDILKKCGNDFMTLSLAFAFVNDMYPNSMVGSLSLYDNSKKDKVCIYLSRIKPLSIKTDCSINIFVDNNRLDISAFKLWCSDNDFKNLLCSDGIDNFVKRALEKKLLIPHEDKYYFSMDGRALATYIDSRMFSKLMK